MTGADNAGAAAAGRHRRRRGAVGRARRAARRRWPATLAGKVVVDCVNPLGFDKQGAYALPVEEGSAAQQAAALLPDSTVVGAFHNVSAVLLEDPDVDEVDTDVLVLGDDREATDLVQALADAIPGVRGVYGGRLRNAHQVEALTANLICDQPPLQGPRRPAGHRHLRLSIYPAYPGPSDRRPSSCTPRSSSSCRTQVLPRARRRTTPTATSAATTTTPSRR